MSTDNLDLIQSESSHECLTQLQSWYKVMNVNKRLIFNSLILTFDLHYLLTSWIIPKTKLGRKHTILYKYLQKM